MNARYINPYTDFGFKKLLGDETNKSLLLDFLFERLPSIPKIVELSFSNFLSAAFSGFPFRDKLFIILTYKQYAIR